MSQRLREEKRRNLEVSGWNVERSENSLGTLRSIGIVGKEALKYAL